MTSLPRRPGGGWNGRAETSPNGFVYLAKRVCVPAGGYCDLEGKSTEMGMRTLEKKVVDRVSKQLFIGGEWRDAASGRTLAVEDPSNQETLAWVADARPEDSVAALDAAAKAQDAWARHPPRERGEILRRAFEAILDRSDELALLMTLEMGKPITDSKAEVAYATEFFRWFSEEAVRIEGRYAVAPSGKGGC